MIGAVNAVAIGTVAIVMMLVMIMMFWIMPLMRYKKISGDHLPSSHTDNSKTNWILIFMEVQDSRESTHKHTHNKSLLELWRQSLL